MILFYSDFCQHCKVLLETIKRHDKNNIIKTVSIDTLRSLKKPIDPKIHSVPALLIINTKEYLFGKAVFDYLLLPNRGVLFSTNITREKQSKDTQDLSFTKDIPKEPSAFSLGTISSEMFSSVDDSQDILQDITYNWDTIESIQTQNIDTKESPSDDSDKKKLPTMEEIMKQRANDII